jgi:hypothetical protein
LLAKAETIRSEKKSTAVTRFFHGCLGEPGIANGQSFQAALSVDKISNVQPSDTLMRISHHF